MTTDIAENRAKYLAYLRDPVNQEKYCVYSSIWEPQISGEPKFCALGAVFRSCDINPDDTPSVSVKYRVAEFALGISDSVSWEINCKNDGGTPWPDIADWLELTNWRG